MLKFMNLKILDGNNFSQVKGMIKKIRLGRPGTSLKVGFLGMSNIGKSSTFNLLSNLNVPA
jgi:ribosome biogenesis GTPase A